MQVSDASASACRSVAKATKVRILHLPPRAPRGCDLRKRGPQPLAYWEEIQPARRTTASGRLPSVGATREVARVSSGGRPRTP